MTTDLYWIQGPWPGRLAVMPRPRGGDWLEDEVRSWRQAGVDVVVSLLTPDEIADLRLEAEAEMCRAHGMEFLSFPITDRSVPPSRDATTGLASKIAERLVEGKNVAIHCRQGIGRAPLIAVCVLIGSGVDTETAIQRVGVARGCPVPETMEQRRWLTMAATSRNIRFGICISTGAEDDLQVGKVYRILPDAKADEVGCFRVIDDSGEDYLYAARRFVLVDVPPNKRRSLLKAVNGESASTKT